MIHDGQQSCDFELRDDVRMVRQHGGDPSFYAAGGYINQAAIPGHMHNDTPRDRLPLSTLC